MRIRSYASKDVALNEDLFKVISHIDGDVPFGWDSLEYVVAGSNFYGLKRSCFGVALVKPVVGACPNNDTPHLALGGQFSEFRFEVWSTFSWKPFAVVYVVAIEDRRVLRCSSAHTIPWFWPAQYDAFAGLGFYTKCVAPEDGPTRVELWWWNIWHIEGSE